MQQNKAAAQTPAIVPQNPWNASEIAAPQPCKYIFPYQVQPSEKLLENKSI